MTSYREEPAEPASFPTELRDYDPIHPQGLTLSGLLRRAWAIVLAIGLAALKFGAFIVKFFGIFISVGGYALIWGWRFAIGFVALILVHEMGHFLEARRQGLKPALPVFIPFLGAYVAIKDAPRDPWRNGLISMAGPVLGSIGAAGVWALGEAIDSRLLVALAFSGLLLNLINLLPIVPLDGGFTWGSVRALWHHRHDPLRSGMGTRALVLCGAYLCLAALLAYGAYLAYVPQDRL